MQIVDKTELLVRPAVDSDAQDLFGLLSLCFADYPGCFVDPHDDLPDLLRAGQSFPAPGGFFVVEDASGRVAACIALDFPDEQTAELHRLYVRPDMHRKGLGRRLSAMIEERARAHGAKRIILYSDTRFFNAHALYEGLGYRRLPGERPLGDISNSFEYRFEKDF